MLYIDLPLFMASTFSISSFYLVSQKELFPKHWLRALLFLPLLMSLDRTDHHQHNCRCSRRWWASKQPLPALQIPRGFQEGQSLRGKVRKRLGWVPWIELMIGTYFTLTIVYAIDTEITSPSLSCCCS